MVPFQDNYSEVLSAQPWSKRTSVLCLWKVHAAESVAKTRHRLNGDNSKCGPFHWKSVMLHHQGTC